MLILGIETSGSYASVALSGEQGLIAEYIYAAQRRVCSTLTTYIEHLLKENGSRAKEISAIGVSQGPGSFTGLRVGLATANAMAQALKIPVIGIPTLKVIACSLPPLPKTVACVTTPSRRDEVYAQNWRCTDANWEEESKIQAQKIDLLIQKLIKENRVNFLVGEKATEWRSLIAGKNALAEEKPSLQTVNLFPRAGKVAELTRQALLDHAFVPGGYVLPIYIRRSQPEEKLAEVEKG